MGSWIKQQGKFEHLSWIELSMLMEPHFDFSFQPATLHCQGEWTLAHEETLASLFPQLLLQLKSKKLTKLILDGEQLQHIDSVGSWWLEKLFEFLQSQHIHYQLKNFSSTQTEFLKLFSEKKEECKSTPVRAYLPWLAQVGKSFIESIQELGQFISFIGDIFSTLLFLLLHPKRIPFRNLFNVVQTSGFDALPITGLLSFLIGIVLTYQMGLQLRNYGANIFIVDLLALSILREFAPMMTAIIIAGRSGSAFTAQIGTMKVNQEIDALSTLGIKPVERLVTPKLLGLLISLPLVTVWTDALGLLGGMIMSKSILGIHFSYFIQRFDEVVPLRWYVIGLIKTPVFALLIASIGCFQGLKVQYTADSVGTHTTISVVQSIFMIITFDAFFSILLSWLKI